MRKSRFSEAQIDASQRPAFFGLMRGTDLLIAEAASDLH